MAEFAVGMKVGKIGSSFGPTDRYHGTGVVEKVDGRGNLSVRIEGKEKVERYTRGGELFGSDGYYRTRIVPVETYLEWRAKDRPKIALEQLKSDVHRVNRLPIDAALAEKLIGLIREISATPTETTR